MARKRGRPNRIYDGDQLHGNLTVHARLQNAMHEAVMNVVNRRRQIQRQNMAKIDPDMAMELFPTIQTSMDAYKHMFEELLEQSANGDQASKKLMWERYSPKPKMPYVHIPEIKNKPPAEAAAIIASHVASGEISPDVGESLIKIVQSAATIREAEANISLMQKMETEICPGHTSQKQSD